MKSMYFHIDKSGKIKQVSKLKHIYYKTIDKFKKWRFINSYKYLIIPNNKTDGVFRLSDKEYEAAEEIYKTKGTISYEFYPCGGIGWGVKLHVLDTGEIIDITDIDSW